MLFRRLTTVLTMTLSFFLPEKGEMVIRVPSRDRLTLTLSKCFLASPSFPFTVSVLPSIDAVTPSGNSTAFARTCSVDIAYKSASDVFLLCFHVRHDPLRSRDYQSPHTHRW